MAIVIAAQSIHIQQFPFCFVSTGRIVYHQSRRLHCIKDDEEIIDQRGGEEDDETDKEIELYFRQRIYCDADLRSASLGIGHHMESRQSLEAPRLNAEAMER